MQAFYFYMTQCLSPQPHVPRVESSREEMPTSFFLTSWASQFCVACFQSERIISPLLLSTPARPEEPSHVTAWMESCEVLNDEGRHPLLSFIIFSPSFCSVFFCICSHSFCLWLMSADGRQIKNIARDVGALISNSCGDLWAAVWEQPRLVSTIYCIPESNPLSELHTGRVCCCIQYGMYPTDFSSNRVFAKIQHWFFNSSSKGLVVTVGFDWSRWANIETDFPQRLPGRPDVPVKFICIFKCFGCHSDIFPCAFWYVPSAHLCPIPQLELTSSVRVPL